MTVQRFFRVDISNWCVTVCQSGSVVLGIGAVAIGIAPVTLAAATRAGAVTQGGAGAIAIALATLAFVKFATAILARCPLARAAAIAIDSLLTPAAAALNLS